MLSVVTTFDTSKHHIHIECYITDLNGIRRTVAGVLDSGAPQTEFSDKFLEYAGIIKIPNQKAVIKKELETQKYGKIILPSIEICAHTLKKFPIYVSNFNEDWGIDALIGLDFFRKFKVTIDYRRSQIITENFCNDV